MFSGVSGLRTHQTRMDVIGNNIANVNTVGFKSSRATFQEIFSQTLRGASAPDANSGRGGTNPMQVGLGIGLASIDTLTTRGSVQRTDYPYDLAIDGDGFFIVKGTEGSGYKFTRAGNFGLDELGNLVAPSGLNVYGWLEYSFDVESGEYVFNTEASIAPINFYYDEINGNKRICEPKATENMRLTGNLDSSYKVLDDPDKMNNPKNDLTATDNYFKLPVSCFDALGNEYYLEVYFAKANSTNPSEWTFTIAKENSSADFTFGGNDFATGTITFDANGKPSGGTVFNLTLTPGASKGTTPVEITINLGGITAYSAESSGKASFVDGYKAGSLYNFSIGADGIITGFYDNGQQKPLGKIALAMFENPAGLMKVGENLFEMTVNSGDFNTIVSPGLGGSGSLSPGTLEMSNVDLSKEFTEMIITQRGFQANSRIITTSDEMLQELVNLKR